MWVKKKLLVQIKNLGPKKVLGPKKISEKNIWFQNIFGSKKFGGGGVKTVVTSSLDYGKHTYQILASYYAWNPPKSFW